MKILIAGATGTIGKHITAALQKDHEVINGSCSKNELTNK
jgi:nucleoside-diphosphate-sugar epimerase